MASPQHRTLIFPSHQQASAATPTRNLSTSQFSIYILALHKVKLILNRGDSRLHRSPRRRNTASVLLTIPLQARRWDPMRMTRSTNSIVEQKQQNLVAVVRSCQNQPTKGRSQGLLHLLLRLLNSTGQASDAVTLTHHHKRRCDAQNRDSMNAGNAPV